MKKFIKLTLLLLLCLASLFTFIACGEEETTTTIDTGTSVGLEYRMNDEKTGYIVTGIGTCADNDIVIPTIYEELPVIGIASGAFKNCARLTSMTIPGTVVSVGSAAFQGCTGLIKVENGNSYGIVT